MASAAAGVSSSPVVRRRVAFVTGVTGQDGSYLTEFLLAKGYEVHGACDVSLRRRHTAMISMPSCGATLHTFA